MRLPTSTSTNSPAQLPFWRQLRWNLIGYFVLLAVVPLGVVQYITLTQTNALAQGQVLNQLQSVSTLKLNQIQQWLEAGRQQMLSVLGPDDKQTIIGFLTTPADDLQAQIDHSLSYVISPDSTDSNPANNSLLDRLFIYNADGKIVAASDEADLGKVVTRQPYYQKNQTVGRTQPPFYSVSTGQLTIIRTEPILSQGQTIGVLAGEFNVSTLGTIMTERSGLDETGDTYLVSSENNYLLTPSRFAGYVTTRSYHTEGIDKALLGQSGSGLYVGYRGIPVFGQYRWVPELQAGLLAEQDQTEALTDVQDIVNKGILVALLSALVTIVIGFAIITRISNPLRTLTHAATEIAKGNLSSRADIRQRNELGTLAYAFNQMTGQLAQNIYQLDQQVLQINRTNKELQAASAQAREAARVKSEFMATMSHELRTPLNAMLGFSSILLEGMAGEIDSEAEHMITRIQSNSERLLNLINGVLDIAKIEAGRLEIINRPVELRQLLEIWRGQMGVLAEQKHLAFNVQIDPALPNVISIDAERLSQIAINLLSNAFKFTEAGSVTLSANASSNQLQIEVTDTGIGIPPHALNFIFEEFRQLDGSTRRAYGGTGLGLAIVRNLCRMMDGNVRVRSDLGQGSTFTVTLPLNPVYETIAA